MFSSNYQISLIKNTQSNFEIAASAKKYKKVKLKMNEDEIFLCKFLFWCGCIYHICNLLSNVFLDKYGLSSNNFHTHLSPLSEV